jgi:inorganic phosphate transporter, PiT family
MFGLETGPTIVLVLCVLCVCVFEFINGFHDTANAVATVIYTNSLAPRTAVIWSGICNFAGVFAGGITVAMGIISLLPLAALTDQSTAHSLALVLALLLTAIFWNLGTWYLGLPCSSSHTLVGSILGVGIAYALLPGAGQVDINYSKITETSLSLLFSPLLGFGATFLLMRLLRRTVKDPVLFKSPEGADIPPIRIRATLWLTCTAVSFFHGMNDGQKGIGLMMLVLIGVVPAHFALNQEIDPYSVRGDLQQVQTSLARVDTNNVAAEARPRFVAIRRRAAELDSRLPRMARAQATGDTTRAEMIDNFALRRDILLLTSDLKKLPSGIIPSAEQESLSAASKSLRKLTDYAPIWVTLLISVSLGLGTTIGWKRIVKTIGEKIGKSHLTYAQGASAELIAAATIGLSSGFGLPVSTTHVLSSGVAGGMVAEDGSKNLQPKTVRSIAIAWLLTLPVCITVAALLFWLLRWLM